MRGLTRRQTLRAAAGLGTFAIIGRAQAARPFKPTDSLVEAARREGKIVLYTATFVEVEQEDQASMLSLIRSLLDLRRREPALSQGDYHTRAIEGDVLVYRRSGPERSFIVALNFEPLPKLVLSRPRLMRTAPGSRLCAARAAMIFS